MLTRSTRWMAAIGILSLVFALGLVLGVVFEARTSRGLASELASPRGPVIISGALGAQNGAGTAFTYQGRLQDAGGPADGRFDFLFRLFDAPVDGAQVGETLCVDFIPVSDGLFTVLLDFGQQYATPDPRFLEIEVRRTGPDCGDLTGFVLLTPRQQLTAAPLASHASAAFALDAADGSPASAVFVDADGRVGIGTTTPASRLHVAEPAPVLLLQDTDSAGAEQVGSVTFRDSAGSTKGFLAFDSTTNDNLVLMNRAGNGTTSLGAGSFEQLTVMPDGKVGIGTTSPLHWLHVAVPAPVLALQDTDSAGAEQVGYVSFRDSANVERGWVGFGSPSNFDVTLANNTILGTTSLGAGGLARVTVTPGGNVGVGTTAPSAKLDVRGDIRLGPNGQFRATSGEENLRIVRGVVSATGGIIAGSGFTVSHPSQGRYTVTFNTPFAGPPAVTATAHSEFTNRITAVMTTGVTGNVANFEVVIDGGNETNGTFHFTAIGPR